MPNYGDKQYWDKRYKEQKQKTFDWLEDYIALKPIIMNIATKESKILMLGCGNSELSEDMYVDGFENIYNIDISPVVIEQMKDRNAYMTNMKYEVMDALDMSFPDNYFDVVIDKSTIDAILCGECSFLNTAKMMKEVQRVLKVGGIYFIISYGTPENRLLHLTREHLSWKVSYFIFEQVYKDIGAHYGYLAQKNYDAEEVCVENWEMIEKYLILEEEKEKAIEAQLRATGMIPETSDAIGRAVDNNIDNNEDEDKDEVEETLKIEKYR